MSPRSGHEDLKRRIGEVVAEHLAASEEVARDALARAFGAARTRLTRRTGARSGWQKRPRSELDALAVRLCEAVRARPGETMTVLAGVVGATARALLHPMALLKEAEKVRSIGQRNATRYFPLT